MQFEFHDLKRDVLMDAGHFSDEPLGIAWGQALANRNHTTVYAVTADGDAFHLTPVHSSGQQRDLSVQSARN